MGGGGGFQQPDSQVERCRSWPGSTKVLYLDLRGDNSWSYKGATCDLTRLTSLLRRAEEGSHVHTRSTPA